MGSHLILPGSHLREMKILHMNTSKWASPVRWCRAFLISGVFFRCSLNNIWTFVLNELNFCRNLLLMALRHCLLWKMLKNYVSKHSFSSGITNFLIEVRQKIPYKRGMKIASFRWASPPSWISSPHMNSLFMKRFSFSTKLSDFNEV